MKHHRLYISADIEGTVGVTSTEQTGPAGFEYAQAREWMTNEVIAACEAAFENGITEIVVSDSHGNAQNILPDKLPAGVKLVRSWPRPLCMMQGIELGLNFPFSVGHSLSQCMTIVREILEKEPRSNLEQRYKRKIKETGGRRGFLQPKYRSGQR